MPSGTPFPIFISSTVYDLADLRTELCEFLREMGYEPRVSEEYDFPDNYPTHPWESCLDVLASCFVMVLILNGRYGTAVTWTKHRDAVGSESLAPTHAEYRFARHHSIRLLVLVREQVLADYQRYREALAAAREELKADATPEKCREYARGRLFLPRGRVEFDELTFLEEVKTKDGVWINTFRTVSDVKRTVQSQLLNEFASAFTARTRTAVIDQFASILSGVRPEERLKILSSIPGTRDLVDELAKKDDRLIERERELATAQQAAQELRTQLEGTTAESASARDKLGAELRKKAAKVAKLRTDVQRLEQERNEAIERGSASIFGNVTFKTSPALMGLAASGGFVPLGQIGGTKCDRCGVTGTPETGLAGASHVYNFPGRLRRCYGCNRNLCGRCWPEIGYTAISGLTVEGPTSTLVFGTPKTCDTCHVPLE